MNDEKEKWMEGVFQSMKGSQRAKPKPDLFAKIEDQIAAPGAKVVSIHQWRFAAAAAALLLVLNVYALRQYTQNNESTVSEMVVSDASQQSLISNYKIYE